MQQVHPPGCGQTRAFQGTSYQDVGPHILLEYHTHFGASADLVPGSFSFIFILFIFLSIRKGSAGPDLPVAVQPLLHHLGHQRVAAPPRALLHGHQHTPLSHTAVQPLTEQALLLLLVT